MMHPVTVTGSRWHAGYAFHREEVLRADPEAARPWWCLATKGKPSSSYITCMHGITVLTSMMSQVAEMIIDRANRAAVSYKYRIIHHIAKAVMMLISVPTTAEVGEGGAVQVAQVEGKQCLPEWPGLNLRDRQVHLSCCSITMYCSCCSITMYVL